MGRVPVGLDNLSRKLVGFPPVSKWYVRSVPSGIPGRPSYMIDRREVESRKVIERIGYTFRCVADALDWLSDHGETAYLARLK